MRFVGKIGYGDEELGEWRNYGLESLVKEGRKISEMEVGKIRYGGIEGRKTSKMEVGN